SVLTIHKGRASVNAFGTTARDGGERKRSVWRNSMTCFYRSNQINPQVQPYVHATIEHHYKYGGLRLSERSFHLFCFDKFVQLEGRPFNPHTTYHAYDAVVERDGEILYEITHRED